MEAPDSGQIRVAYLIEQLATGGAERQLGELLSRLDRQKYTPLVVTGWGEGFLLERVSSLNVPVRFVRGRFGGGKLATIAVLRELLRSRPAIIHASGFTASMWGTTAKLVLRRPKFIAGVRGANSDLTRSQAFVERHLQGVPDAIVANTRFHAGEWVRRGVPPDRMHVIPNGIDLGAFPGQVHRVTARARLGIPPDVPCVGMVGSFRQLKRWDLFLRAAAGLPAEAHIVCVGEGPLRADMEALAGELGIQSRTLFCGERADVFELLPALDVLVSASDTEGLSNAILEAMAASLPVVATHVGGTPELVEDGRTGVLVHAGDFQAIRDAVAGLLADSDRAGGMGHAGRERVEREFDLSICAWRTEALYASLLGQVQDHEPAIDTQAQP